MKANLSILVVFFCLFSSVSFAQEKSKKELKAERELQKQKDIETLIDSKKFDFEAQKATPQGGRFIILDYSTYFLKFSPDKITCDLPFFGRGFNIPYGGDGGIKFEGTPENMRIDKKNKNYDLRVTVRGENDIYDLRLTIFFNGNATLFINSNNRASISYDGVIRSPRTDEVKE
jgi:hypothetical protein